MREDSPVVDLKGVASYSVCWHPSKKEVLACAGYDGKIRIFDTKANRQLRELNGHTFSLLSVSWAGDGSTIASAGKDARVKLWDFVRSQPQENIRDLYDVNSLEWCRDDQSVVTGVRRDGVEIHDLKTKQITRLSFSDTVSIEGTNDAMPRVTELAITENGWLVICFVFRS